VSRRPRPAGAGRVEDEHPSGLVEGRRQGREVRYAIRPQRLDAATRSMAQVAAEWDARLAAISASPSPVGA
jgi:hypothetical protein